MSLPAVQPILSRWSLYFYIKYACDRILALLALLLLAPLMLVIIIAIKIASPSGSVFFGHQRIGYLGHTFTCWKFRTMIPNADKILQHYLDTNPAYKKEFDETFKLKKDPRILPIIGHFLRFTSLDELPQIFNVLLGQMSWVGPRPIVQDEVARYGQYFADFISIKPGMSGLWQVSGRNDISYQKRIELDVYYVHHAHFLMDCAIVFRTLGVIFMHQGY